MALKPDDTVCFCFHVSLRKIETFCKVEKPQTASQISECLSAGTGCGWCVPIIKKIHYRICGENLPWWRKEAAEQPLERPIDTADILDAAAYKNERKKYLAEGKGKAPPPDAEL